MLSYSNLGSGPPVLLLHGLFGSKRNWQSVAKNLSNAHSVFAIDLRNHGQSPHYDEMNYALMANDVAALMDQLELDSAAILGHSMGGKVALQFAQDYPARLRRLLVVDIAPVTYPDRYSDLIEAMQNLSLQSFDRRAQVEERLTKAIPDRSLRRFLMHNLVKLADGAFAWQLNLSAIAVNLPNLLGFSSPTTAAKSANYDGPALAIRGELSDYLDTRGFAELKVLLPQTELQSISGAGHWVHAEQPAVFLEVVRQFLEAEV